MKYSELEEAFNETTDNAVDLLKENIELKKKLEKLIKKYNRNYENGLNDFLELLDVKEENRKLKAELELYENGVYYSSENDKLQERIDEAIEYIEKKQKDDDNWLDYELCIEPQVLLDILKGDNNEEIH